MADASLLALSGPSTPFMPLCRTALGASVWPSVLALRLTESLGWDLFPDDITEVAGRVEHTGALQPEGQEALWRPRGGRPPIQTCGRRARVPPLFSWVSRARKPKLIFQASAGMGYRRATMLGLFGQGTLGSSPTPLSASRPAHSSLITRESVLGFT